MDSMEVSPGVVIDLDGEENIVGIDIDRASRIIEMAKLHMIALPIENLSVEKGAYPGK